MTWRRARGAPEPDQSAVILVDTDVLIAHLCGIDAATFPVLSWIILRVRRASLALSAFWMQTALIRPS